MHEQLQQLEKKFRSALENIDTQENLKELENEYLGKKGKLKAILAGVKDLSIEEKKTVGVAANQMKDEFISALETKALELENAYFENLEEQESVDVTLGYPSKNI